MITYPFEFVEKHIIFDADGQRVLLDTGAPSSIGSAGEFHFLGSEHHLADNFLGLTVDELSELIGARVDVLLGMDVIGSQPLTIDAAAGTLGFGDGAPAGGTVLPLESVMGVPSLAANIAGRDLRAFFDTGAVISFVPPDMIDGRPVERRVEDFYPGIGKFETDLCRLPCRLGNESIDLDSGVLPDELQMALGMTGVTAIVGLEVCGRWTVVVDMEKAELRLVG